MIIHFFTSFFMVKTKINFKKALMHLVNFKKSNFYFKMSNFYFKMSNLMIKRPFFISNCISFIK